MADNYGKVVQVIGPSVDVKKSVDDLIDDRYVTAAN